MAGQRTKYSVFFILALGTLKWTAVKLNTPKVMQHVLATYFMRTKIMPSKVNPRPGRGGGQIFPSLMFFENIRKLTS